MSYPNEDRHERDVVGGQSRNPSQDGEKHDKSKVLNANPGGILLFRPSCVVWFFKMSYSWRIAVKSNRFSEYVVIMKSNRLHLIPF